MDRPIPLPSHIHYELLLRLLERETASAIYQRPLQNGQLQELIITLRKALSQQKQLEASCKAAEIPVEYHWSLNDEQRPSSG